MNRRCAVALMLIAAASIGCAPALPGAPAVAPPAGADPTRPASFGEPPSVAPPVPAPKDARGVAPCDLLTDEQLEELDLIPGSAVESLSDVAQSCSWTSALDDTNPAGLVINTITGIAALDFIYATRPDNERFVPTEVAGHPAVRVDFVADNSCTLYTGIADHQGVSTEHNTANRPLPDPCDIPRRMAEFILSNLPPLT